MRQHLNALFTTVLGFLLAPPVEERDGQRRSWMSIPRPRSQRQRRQAARRVR